MVRHSEVERTVMKFSETAKKVFCSVYVSFEEIIRLFEIEFLTWRVWDIF